MYDKLYLYDFASFDTEDEERHTDNLSCTDKFFLRYVDGGTKGGGVGHAEREFGRARYQVLVRKQKIRLHVIYEPLEFAK